MGAGLPTQRVSGRLHVFQSGYEYLGRVWGNPSLELSEFERRHHSEVGLHCRHLRADPLLELSSFVWRHRFKKELQLFHLCFDRFCRGGIWTVSSVMSFLLASVTRSSYVGSVLPWRGVGRSIRCRSDLRQRLAEPG